MNRLAGEIVFSRVGIGSGMSVPVMTIDGEPFPYYVSEEGPTVALDPSTGIYTVSVPIMADKVTVDLASPFTAEDSS